MALLDTDTGKEMTFPEVVAAILVEEHGKSKEDAERMVKTHTNIVVNGIMAGNYRATAMALEMAESKSV